MKKNFLSHHFALIIIMILLLSLCMVSGSAEMQMPPADTNIQLSDIGILVEGSGALVNGNTVTITGGGVYRLSGTLSNGQVFIDAGKNDNVSLLLDGVDITNLTDSAIDASKMDELTLWLCPDTQNRLVSGKTVDVLTTRDNPDAQGGVITSKCDLDICGNGFLFVGGYINNGIQTSKDLSVKDGQITIESINRALEGKKSVSVEGGSITISCGNDAIHSDGKEDDDSENGEIFIGGGNVRILNCREGMEAHDIEIKGGSVEINSIDDGINASGKTVIRKLPSIEIEGGTIYISTAGDGIDSNGNLEITGGFVTIDGAGSSDSNALECGITDGGKLSLRGGTVICLDMSGEGYYSDILSDDVLVHEFDTSETAGSAMTIVSSSGDLLCSHNSIRQFNTIIFCAPSLVRGDTCTVTAGARTASVTIGR